MKHHILKIDQEGIEFGICHDLLPENSPYNLTTPESARFALGAERQNVMDELKHLRDHPVIRHYNWWNTGALMNSSRVYSYERDLDYYTKRLEKVNNLIAQIEDPHSNFPEYEVVGDGLGDGTWVKEKKPKTNSEWEKD